MSGKSLYIHYPFCKKKCPYCHFFVLPENQQGEEIWLKGVQKELSLYSITDPITVYFGGGTPSLMPPEWVEQLLFSKPQEVTLEINPEEITKEKLKAFKKAGINRCSVGVQSLQKEELILLGREHVPDRVETLLYTLADVGFENVSIDLMYDVPGQTFDSLKRSLDRLLTLPFTHLSLYNLTIEPHTLFYKRREALEKMRPSPKVSEEQFLYVRERLQVAGFEHYEISAFAKKGFRAIHNSGYWLGREFYGIGPSSFSFLDGVRRQNFSHLGKWSQALDKGEKPIELEDRLPAVDRLLELFVVHLRWLDGVDLPSFQERWGLLPSRTLKTLEKMESLGLIEKGPKLTLKGILLFDELAVDLI